MPRNAKDDVFIESGPRCLLEQPKLAALMGVIASEWAGIEYNMTWLYGSLLGQHVPHVRNSFNPIGTQIFETLTTQHHRENLIRKLTKYVITDPGMLDRLEPLLNDINKASRIRNKYIHGIWGYNKEQCPDALLLVMGPGKFEIHDESDFNEAVDFIVSTADAISKFEMDVITHIKKPGGVKKGHIL
jgi:hypothetical protein